MSFEPVLSIFFIFLVGMTAGFFSSSPPGPINLWVVQAILAREKGRFIFFIAGVICIDVFFGLIALLGYHTMFSSFLSTQPMALLGEGILMTAIGVACIYHVKQKKYISNKNNIITPNCTNGSLMRDFLIGMLFCGTNPGFLVFWLFIIDVSFKLSHVKLERVSAGFFAAGIICGDILWFSTLSYMTRKSMKWLSPTLLSIIRLSIGGVFLIGGVYILFQIPLRSY